MAFNAIKFCEDYNIPKKTEGKNCHDGWMQINCIFHSPVDTGFHLGFNLAEDYCNCWQCGHHSLVDTIMELTSSTAYEAFQIIKTYSNKSTLKTKEPKRKISSVELPIGTSNLQQQHKDYLIKRNFDPDYLEKVFDLKGTTYRGDYKFRIIAPIYLNNQLISFQGRDITNKSELRYKACSKLLEVVYHKHSLYAVDLVRDDRVVIVEGITDNWRMGEGAVSTYGTGWTTAQMMMLVDKFKSAAILYDPEDPAQIKAEKLMWNLSALGLKNIDIITGITCDPGSLSDTEAKYIMKNIK